MREVDKLVQSLMKRTTKASPADATHAAVYLLSALVFANAMQFGVPRGLQIPAIREQAISHLDALLKIVEGLSQDAQTLQ